MCAQKKVVEIATGLYPLMADAPPSVPVSWKTLNNGQRVSQGQRHSDKLVLTPIDRVSLSRSDNPSSFEVLVQLPRFVSVVLSAYTTVRCSCCFAQMQAVECSGCPLLFL